MIKQKIAYQFMLPAKFIVLFISLIFSVVSWSADLPITLFPIENYSQNVDQWLNPADPNYTKALLSFSYQAQRFQQMLNHFFVPWNAEAVSLILQQAPNISAIEINLLDKFDNAKVNPQQLGYGENFRPYPPRWINTIKAAMHFSQFTLPLKFHAAQRGILVQNTAVRALPTDDVYFYNYALPGEGYPFDNLQVSAIWAGTPVYVLGKTKDQQYSLILAPTLIGWIKTTAIANAGNEFITTWQRQARQSMAAITQTAAPISDSFSQQIRFMAYIGAIFPEIASTTSSIKIMIPVKTLNGNAYIRYALLSKAQAIHMPMRATPKNFAYLMKSLQGRPYGWGRSYFYNDCSAELNSLYTPFGIWLPVYSGDQIDMGRVEDKTDLTAEQRIKYLLDKGQPLLTIVYIGGHVFMYVGNYANPASSEHELIAMSYQNIWGLAPKDKGHRAIIGKAVFLPLLLSYPEDKKLTSLADKHYFKIVYLDRWPTELSKLRKNFSLQNSIFPN